MCRSITFRYSICTHSWRPYIIPCSNPVKTDATDINSTSICAAYKTRYERRVIKSGNGMCAMCWEKQEKKEKYVRERERILGGKMRERVVGKEKENVRILEDIGEEFEEAFEEGVGNLRRESGGREGGRRNIEERKERGREKNEESEKLLRETEKQTWILEGNGGVRKKLNGNERKGVRNGWLG
ncbi:hypothetical protein EAE96_000887 [Botrytis aclada]|nr:hypothetical protein EAE96_000887 [Botrytis aclada]